MKKQKRGFTLVELLIVMGIMSILLTIFFQVFGAILSMKLRSEATTAVAQDSRYLISRLSYDVSRASDITLPSVGVSGNVLNIIIAGNVYQYQLENGILTLSINGGASQDLNGIGTKITNISFTHFADVGTKKSVQINLTIIPTIIQPGGATGERQLTTTIATR